MKNFSKLLALSVALSLTFGMTVFADYEENYSISTNDTTITNETMQEVANAIDKANPDLEVTGVSVMVYDSAKNLESLDQFADRAANALGVDAETVSTVTLVSKPFDIKGKTGEITLKGLENEVVQGAKYVMWHVSDGGKDEVIPVTVNSDNSITFTISSNSIFALYKVDDSKDTGSDDGDDDNDDAPAVTADGAPASPKTGETLPMAGIAMMIALAGAAVCATKVRYNN